MAKKNIILTGMPGAGKSTVGVLLAKAMGMPFVDTDLLIQQKEGRLLQEIINLEGLERFLDIEEETVLETDIRGHVIATGGSVVYREASMQHLKASGVAVYLDLPFSEIEKRLNNISTRGVAMEEGKTLLELYNERLPLYRKYADVRLDCTGMDIEAVVGAVVDRVMKFL